MNLEERIERHRRMAESYRDKYLRQAVQEGESYDDWKFANGAVYSSPYFTCNQTLSLLDALVTAARSATMEAKAYSLKFPDWKPASFKCWPADNGFVMQTRWQGTSVDGESMGFYSIGIIETNEDCEITRWETHVDDSEYGPFLDIALGRRGPFHGGDEYNQLLEEVLRKAGITVAEDGTVTETGN